eukprot:104406-Chlamydomonas_euryale.AAC.1
MPVEVGDAQPFGAAHAHHRLPRRRAMEVVPHLRRQPRAVALRVEAAADAARARVVHAAARVPRHRRQAGDVDKGAAQKPHVDAELDT